jgi:16S rRNA (cytidine1402-2'-O)-methyltransferase
MNPPGTLYLIPAVIAEGTNARVIPSHVRETITSIHFFLAEDVRTTRRYFSSLKTFESLEALHFEVLNKDTVKDQLPELMRPLLEGSDMGLVSEAGCPGVADPGAIAVEYAHDHNIRVVPLSGPSSIVLALMASGLSGQHFAFHGYLPVGEKEASTSIREFERESRVKMQTQIFIETPYRNGKLLNHLLQNLQHTTRLCVAIDLTSPHEKIICKPVHDWKAEKIDMPKSPAIFLFLAQK